MKKKSILRAVLTAVLSLVATIATEGVSKIDAPSFSNML